MDAADADNHVGPSRYAAIGATGFYHGQFNRYNPQRTGYHCHSLKVIELVDVEPLVILKVTGIMSGKDDQPVRWPPAPTMAVSRGVHC